MTCNKCNGKGWNHNERYWKAKADINSSGYLRYNPSVKCGKCKGSGFIIGNIKEVLDFLKHLQVKFAHDKHYLDQVKNCINTIENI